MDSKLIVGITQGDSAGIGLEIILKAFANPTLLELCTPVLYANESILQSHRRQLGLQTSYRVIPSASEARDGQLNVVGVNADGVETSVTFGCSSESSGRLALAALQAAVNDARDGNIDAIVCAPINIASMPAAFGTSSQNSWLGNQFGGSPLMMLCNPLMRVAMATDHLPLKDVPNAVTSELVENSIRLAYASVKRDFLSAQPRVAVLGLNPHAGASGKMGCEDQDIVAPVIARLAEEDIRVFGPYAADGFFGAGLYKHFDCVLALYHDQGVTPFKSLSMNEGVNYTAGLDVVCVSPDHGPAYDIAGKGEASESSFLQAIYHAIDIYRNREAYDEANAHPLPHVQPRDRREERRGRREE